MAPTNPRNSETEDKENHFRFVAIQNPDAPCDPAQKRLARSHAVRNALRVKRELQEKSNINFQILYPALVAQPHRSAARAPEASLLSLGSLSDTHNPFEMLAVDSSRLKSLLNNYAAKEAAEPIFNVKDEVVFQAFDNVFRTDHDDPALSNAVMLTFEFGVTGGSINQECLGYLNKATKSIREKMDSPDNAASVTVIGAILLLAGVEARLGMRSQVQLHMEAIWQLLSVCAEKDVYLNDGIKRAIFWQDLNCSIMTGSDRMFDHTTFAELLWARDPFAPRFFTLTSGFERLSHLFPEEFSDALRDIHGLQCIRDSPNFICKDTAEILRLDNHQASVQSRLVSMPRLSVFLECCYLAAYIAASQLCTKVWRASSIPIHVSSQLLIKLHEADAENLLDDHPDLLMWLLYTGGAFIPAGSTRSSYAALVNQKRASPFVGLYHSLEDMVLLLKQFVWSDRAFAISMEGFWKEETSM